MGKMRVEIEIEDMSRADIIATYLIFFIIYLIIRHPHAKFASLLALPFMVY